MNCMAWHHIVHECNENKHEMIMNMKLNGMTRNWNAIECKDIAWYVNELTCNENGTAWCDIQLNGWTN